MSQDQADDTAAPSAASDLPEVNPLEMRLVWDSMERPTCTAVAEHFTSRGRPLKASRVENWKHRGWGASDEEHQLALCDETMRRGLKLEFTEQDDELLNMAIMSSLDSGLLRSVTRAAMAASIKASLAIARKSNELAASCPHNMGAGIQRSAAAIPQAVCGLDRLALADQRAVQARGAAEALARGPAAEGVAPVLAELQEDHMAAEFAAFGREARRERLPN